MKHKVPTCPKCNHAMTDGEMYKHWDDLWAIAPKEEMAEIVCPACGVFYFCHGSYTPEYVSALPEGDLR